MICDVCGKEIINLYHVRVMSIIEGYTIGRLHVDCLDEIINIQGKDPMEIGIDTRMYADSYYQAIKYIREVKQYEEINRKGNDRKN